jgi:predicted 2-oxoglutarate/Fe(II)-dependent dioxygenase YbiX
LFALERNPQAENHAFAQFRSSGQKGKGAQVTRQEQLTPENFGRDFRLTGELLGNKIQLPKFLAVAIPSKLILPSNITPDRTGGHEMLILRGEHFFLACPA